MADMQALLEEVKLMRNELQELKQQQAADAMNEDDQDEEQGEEEPQWGEVLPNDYIAPSTPHASALCLMLREPPPWTS